MATIRKYIDKQKVIPTRIAGIFIHSLTFYELQEFNNQYLAIANDKEKDIKTKEQEITMHVLSLACDEHEDNFEEFASYEQAAKSLSAPEMKNIIDAITEALKPSETSEKKS